MGGGRGSEQVEPALVVSALLVSALTPSACFKSVTTSLFRSLLLLLLPPLSSTCFITPQPHAIITAVGTKVFLWDVATERWTPDPGYAMLLNDGWDADRVSEEVQRGGEGDVHWGSRLWRMGTLLCCCLLLCRHLCTPLCPPSLPTPHRHTLQLLMHPPPRPKNTRTGIPPCHRAAQPLQRSGVCCGRRHRAPPQVRNSISRQTPRATRGGS